jgi:acyl carrier protein
MNPTETAAEISSYSDTISDLDQTLAGEELQLDELLQRDSQAAQREMLRSELNVPVPQLKSFADQSLVTTIQDWIANWISNNMKVSSASIRADQSFSEYGMDSILAVEFAQDLATWLNRPVEPMVVWNYSTIGILAQHLAESFMTEHPANSPQSPSSPPDFPDDSADLGSQYISNNGELLSAEEEIASLLATELFQVKQSIKNLKRKINRTIRHPKV